MKKKHIRFAIVLLLVAFLYIWTNPVIRKEGSVKILDRNGILLYEMAGLTGKNQPVEIGDIPIYFINAVIAAEDQTFWSNPGFDVLAVSRAIQQNIRNKKVVSGASTITQQVARSLVIRNLSHTTRSVSRKIREILISIRLNLRYSKNEILALYVNSMYFGRLSYGIGAAAETYFGKIPQRLTLGESAYLAAKLSYPNADHWFTVSRMKYVLERMVEEKNITAKQAQDAATESLAIEKTNDFMKAPHFVDHVISELNTMGFNTSKGLSVITTLDYPVYVLAEEIARRFITNLYAEHDVSNAALVLIDNRTGELLVELGGIDYFDATRSGQVNVVTSARQPGSAIKPFTYLAAFANGDTPATLMHDIKTVFKTKKGEGFVPNNYDGKFHGPVLAREALASSLNVPAVEMLSKVGVSSLLKLLKEAGVSTLTDDGRYDLSLTLGGGEVTLFDLATAYATLARGGEYIPTYIISQITDNEGIVLFRYSRVSPQLILKSKVRELTYLITDILSDPNARALSFGQKNPLVLSRPAAVKTGTTTDWHDNWTVGYTPSYTVGVWVGNTDNHAMRDITGVTGAAPIWNQFFEEFLKHQPKEDFIPPENIQMVEICKFDGLLPSEMCPERLYEKFISGTEPKQLSAAYMNVSVDIRNGLLVSTDCPKQYVADKKFTVYPPEFHAWAVENHWESVPAEMSPLCTSEIRKNGTDSFITILNPRPKSVFQSAAYLVPDEKIVFEVSFSPDITEVTWIIDGTDLPSVTDPPFTKSWQPMKGKHTAQAVGKTSGGKTVKSEFIPFTVTEFGEE